MLLWWRLMRWRSLRCGAHHHQHHLQDHVLGGTRCKFLPASEDMFALIRQLARTLILYKQGHHSVCQSRNVCCCCYAWQVDAFARNKSFHEESLIFRRTWRVIIMTCNYKMEPPLLVDVCVFEFICWISMKFFNLLKIRFPRKNCRVAGKNQYCSFKLNQNRGWTDVLFIEMFPKKDQTTQTICSINRA